MVAMVLPRYFWTTGSKLFGSNCPSIPTFCHSRRESAVAVAAVCFSDLRWRILLGELPQPQKGHQGFRLSPHVRLWSLKRC
jgi:hypothetical protein